MVREFGFLRLPKRSRRARLHDRVRESVSYVRGETSQAESPDAHGPLEAQKIFPLVWQFVVHLVHDTILSSRALRFPYGAQSQKTGLEKAAKTHCYVTSAEGRRDNETRGGEFPPRIALGKFEEVSQRLTRALLARNETFAVSRARGIHRRPFRVSKEIPGSPG